MISLNRILIVRTDSIGDLLLTTPLIHEINSAIKDAHIGVLAGTYALPVLENNPDVKEAFGLERDREQEITEQIKASRYDAAVCVFPKFEIAYMLFRAGIKLRIGTANRWYSPLFFNSRVDMHRKYSVKHEADYNLELGRQLIGEKTAEKVYYFPAEEEMIRARSFAREKGLEKGFVAIHPGSRGSAWNLSPAKYAALAGKVAATGKQVLVTGSWAELQVINEVVQKSGESRRVIALDKSLSLRDFAAVLGQAGTVISGSTGPMHLAAALGVKTLSFFPPDSETAMKALRWHPLGNKSVIVKPEGTFKNPQEAMESIDMDRVIKEFQGLTNA